MRYRTITDEELALALEEGEGCTLEFKSAANSDLPKELVALAMENCPEVRISYNTMFTLDFPRPTYVETQD
ncbi:MAG: hypothetical protein OEL83_02785 [Desulforhopalus sp.]|nr:hypothetical protein [Desulforhopalus sp.]